MLFCLLLEKARQFNRYGQVTIMEQKCLPVFANCFAMLFENRQGGHL